MTACSRQPCHRSASRRGMCAAHYEKNRLRQKAYGRWTSSYIDAEPVRLHIKEVQAAGLGLRRIAELSGVNRKTLQWIINGRSERKTRPSAKISRVNAEKILSVPVPDVPHRSMAGGSRVDAIGTIRRCQALVAAGYTRTEIGARIGWSVSNMGQLLDPATGKVNAVTARKVDIVLRQLEATPGPSVRARNEGRRKGWLLPLAWADDDLDRFVVTVGDDGQELEAPLTFSEQYTELRGLGYDDHRIAQKLGITMESLARQQYRHNLRTAS